MPLEIKYKKYIYLNHTTNEKSELVKKEKERREQMNEGVTG